MPYDLLNEELINRYSDCHKPFAEISSNDSGEALINIEDNAFNFDRITEKLFGGTSIFCSADALYIGKRSLYLIEFKRGFSRDLDTEKMEPDDKECKKCNYYIREFYKQLYKNIEQGKEVLLQNIHLKAIESYYTLVKMILPICKSERSNIRLIFIVVIDASTDPLAAYEEMNYDLASLNQSISKYRKTDENEKPLFYDYTTTLDTKGFEKAFKEGLRM